MILNWLEELQLKPRADEKNDFATDGDFGVAASLVRLPTVVNPDESSESGRMRIVLPGNTARLVCPVHVVSVRYSTCTRAPVRIPLSK